MKKVVVAVPARYESSRFPGKPLALISGKPMIQWVYERIKDTEGVTDVVVATDDTRILETVEGFGGKAVMTGNCSCGTERVHEAVRDIDCDVVVNVQGDEPLIKTEMIKSVIDAFDTDEVVMATLKKAISADEANNPNVVKVISDVNQNAVYFSRNPIPYNRDGIDITYYKHIGIYGYTKDFLNKYVSMEKSSLEKAESLEQLRVLENGYKIKIVETKYDTVGVDVPEDIKRVEALL